MNTIEKRIALLRERTPILAGLLLAMHDRPEIAQLDDWVYNCSGSYATLGAMLSEIHPAYDGLTISPRVSSLDGHNAFEEFVIGVWDAIAEYHDAFDGHKTYDMDKMTCAFMQDILPFENSYDYAEPPTDDTGGGRY